ncbi:MAG: Bax inhibitor-1/YccA family protein [Lawsonibacter sp.]|jgi:FtsH-binding integral membrane protein
MSFDSYEFDRSMTTGQTESLGQYTAKTFLWMVLGLLITFGVAITCWLTGAVYFAYQAQLVVLIATLVLSFTMARRIERMTVGTAISMFVAFSALFGLTLSVYLLLFDVASVIFCFFATALYFGALAAYGYLTRRDLSRMGTILFSGLIFLVVFGVITWFIPGFTAFDQVVCLIGIAVFLGYTAYNTQKIRAYYHYYAGFPDMLTKASIFSALQLYLDFLNLFLYLLRFLGNRRGN